MTHTNITSASSSTEITLSGDLGARCASGNVCLHFSQSESSVDMTDMTGPVPKLNLVAGSSRRAILAPAEDTAVCLAFRPQSKGFERWPRTILTEDAPKPQGPRYFFFGGGDASLLPIAYCMLSVFFC